jgi:hypothetical protein
MFSGQSAPKNLCRIKSPQRKIETTCYLRRFTIARPCSLTTSESDSPGNPVESPTNFDRFILLRYAWIPAFEGMTGKNRSFAVVLGLHVEITNDQSRWAGWVSFHTSGSQLEQLLYTVCSKDEKLVRHVSGPAFFMHSWMKRRRYKCKADVPLKGEYPEILYHCFFMMVHEVVRVFGMWYAKTHKLMCFLRIKQTESFCIVHSHQGVFWQCHCLYWKST